MGRLNKPAKPGYEYRSPGQTNATDLTPNLGEDTVASQRADNERMRRGLEAPAKDAYRRRLQQEAAGRAMIRSGGRAGLLGTAAQGGWELGRAIDESTGAGKKIVDKLGPMIDRAATGDRVKLSKEAEGRIKDEEDFQAVQRALRSVDEEREPRLAKGGYVKKADGIAKRGKTRGKMVMYKGGVYKK